MPSTPAEFRPAFSSDWLPDAALRDAESFVSVHVLREGEELDVAVPIEGHDGRGTSRCLQWAGLLIQEPHRSVLENGFVPSPHRGVYISRWYIQIPAVTP